MLFAFFSFFDKNYFSKKINQYIYLKKYTEKKRSKNGSFSTKNAGSTEFIEIFHRKD